MSTPQPPEGQPADHPAEPPAAPPAGPSAADERHRREHQALGDVKREAGKVAHTRSRATYVGWIVGIVVTIILLVFILRNQESQEIDLVFVKVHLPVGISLLIAALLGAIITVAVTGARVVQLRRALNKVEKARKSAR